MGCELDKVVKAINKVASEVRDPRAISQLNELKNDLNKFAISMETAKPTRDFSKLKSVMSNVEVKATDGISSNVKVVKLDDLKIKPVFSDAGVKTIRDFKTTEHFGNPFLSTRNFKDKGVGTDEEVAKMFSDWLKGFSNKDVEPKRREWIIKQILDGNLDNKPLLYYTNTPVNHAKELEKLIKNKSLLSSESSSKGPEVTNNDNTINIYSEDNNGFSNLSNFNAGPITIKGKEFPTLEHAFQYWKASKASKNGMKESNQKRIMNATSGRNAQKEGKTIPIDTSIWTEAESTRALETVMRRYYSSNEDAKKLLLSTGDKVLTHIGKNNIELDNRFPKILMKIRDELRDTKSTVETEYGTNEETISTDVETETDKYIDTMLSKINPTFKVETDSTLFEKYISGEVSGFAHYNIQENKIVIPVLPEFTESSRIEYAGKILYSKLGFKTSGSDHNYLQKKYGTLTEYNTYDMTNWFEKVLKSDPDSVIEYAKGYYTTSTAAELYTNMITTGFLSEGVLSRVVRHEKVHAYTVKFLNENPDHEVTKSVKRLYKEALSKVPAKGDNTYWRKNVNEFVAEAISNPEVRDILKAVATEQVKNKVSIFDRLVELILKSLGVSRGNIYSELLYALNSIPTDNVEVSKLVESKHLSRYKNSSNIAKNIEKIIDAYDTTEFSNVITTKDKDGEAKRRALWFGEEVYKYSGVRHEATVMHPYVTRIARDIEKETGMPVGYFNSVLINEYKGGKGLKAHRDNESIFIDKDNNIGEIATLTLSGEGKVTIYDNKGKEVESHKVNAGDLYVMPGKQFQNNFRHKVDTVGKATRISLTFRHIPNNDITTEVQSKEEVQLPEAKEGLTRGQTKAYEELSDILTSNTTHTYLLEGPGGTGKSFVIGKVLEKYVADTNGAVPTIVGSAVAHAAKDVLGDFIEGSLGEDANAKFKRNVALQLGKVIDSHATSRNTNPLVIVLDEVSMVDSISINMLLQKVEFANSVGKPTKIVLLGDRAQLRPIMTTDKFKVEYMSVPGGEDFYYVSINSINYVLNSSKTGLVGIDSSIVSGNVIDGEFVIDTDKFSKLKLKSSIFMNNLSGTTLLENMRNPELAKVFDKFRTGDDVIETSKQAEDQNKYKLQYANGIKALKEAKNSKGDNLTVDLSTEQLPNDVLKSWINGNTSVVAYKNDTVRDINEKMTRIAAHSKGEKAVKQVNKYGVFTGQAYRSTVNMLTPGMPTTKTTNNTLAVVTDVGNANEKLHNGAVEVSKGQSTMLYEGSAVLDLARGSFREDPDNLYVYGLRLNMKKIPTDIKEKITIGTVRYAKAGEPGVFEEIVGILGYTGNVNVTKLVKEYGEVVQYMYEEGIPTETGAYSLGNLNYKAFEGIASAEFDIESFRPTFAMTVHKSQGQTLENVIVVEEWSNWSAMSAVNKLESMYVAVSRSKTKVVLAGSSRDRLMNIAESKKKDAIIAPINSQIARDIQGCNK